MTGKQQAILLVVLALILVLIVWVRNEEIPKIEVPPRVLVLEGWHGKNHHRMNGFYRLLERRHRDRPVWAKEAPGINDSESYLLYDNCGAWLLSHHPTGEDSHCDGWAFAGSRCKLPWKCNGEWQVYHGKALGWGRVTELFEITPLWDPQLMPDTCGEADERALEEEFGNIDLVIPWINGSDPAWLERRHEACYDWQWRWMWPDAVRIPGSRAADCLLKKESGRLPPFGGPPAVEEQGDSGEGACPAGGEGSECSTASRVPPALAVAEASECFREFAEFHCGGRVKSIGDHDELRYLVRSLEANLRWHRGRLLLVLPRGQRPSWLKEDGKLGRLKVVEQETILEAVAASPHFIPHALRGGPGGVLPDRIFNDFPIQNAFPFIENVTRHILLMDDDLVVAKPMSICELFTASKGMKLFADPWYKPDDKEDPYGMVFRSLVRFSARAWEALQRRLANKRGKGTPRHSELTPYFDPYHAPRLLDMRLFEYLWEQFPAELSATTDSVVRHPKMVDIIGFHHAEVFARSLAARKGLARQEEEVQARGRTAEKVERDASGDFSSWVLDLQEYPGDLVPLEKRWFWEVYFDAGTKEESGPGTLLHQGGAGCIGMQNQVIWSFSTISPSCQAQSPRSFRSFSASRITSRSPEDRRQRYLEPPSICRPPSRCSPAQSDCVWEEWLDGLRPGALAGPAPPRALCLRGSRAASGPLLESQ
mmetsp:Transcript_73609/g.239621  ORF Transcript_73609/g.239621 Transcript_73609/m.239621 type:complete len:709 (-) Transcript_73609:52-2178(-)